MAISEDFIMNMKSSYKEILSKAFGLNEKREITLAFFPFELSDNGDIDMCEQSNATHFLIFPQIKDSHILLPIDCDEWRNVENKKLYDIKSVFNITNENIKAKMIVDIKYMLSLYGELSKFTSEEQENEMGCKLIKLGISK